MKQILKKTVTGLLMIICLIAANIQVQAATPLSLTLELPSETLKSGEQAEVLISLQNYDESYTDNVITTIIIETSVNTELLTIDEDSIGVDLEDGEGMGFSVAQMNGANNVELQYVNVGDPLAKGTKKLYHFTVTANQEITALSDVIQITYGLLQDGTQPESVKLTAVPSVMIGGKAKQQGKIDEKYTSDYSTNANVKNSLINTEVEPAAETESAGKNTENAGTSSTSEKTGEGQTQSVKTEVVTAENGEPVTNENGETVTVVVTQSSDQAEGEDSSQTQSTIENTKKDTNNTKRTEDAETENGAGIAIVVILLTLVAGITAAAVWKKKSREQ